MGELTHDQMRDMVRKTREANDQRYEAHSQRTLQRHIKTKLKTTMIAALAKFEELFGHLWGHRKEDRDLTEEERGWRETWELARTEILNKGNDQSRAAANEIDQYTVKFNRNHYTFQVQDKKGLIEDE